MIFATMLERIKSVFVKLYPDVYQNIYDETEK